MNYMWYYIKQWMWKVDLKHMKCQCLKIKLVDLCSESAWNGFGDQGSIVNLSLYVLFKDKTVIIVGLPFDAEPCNCIAIDLGSSMVHFWLHFPYTTGMIHSRLFWWFRFFFQRLNNHVNLFILKLNGEQMFFSALFLFWQ